jgi:hypothetical protein
MIAAAGLGFGAALGALPLGGWQVLLALYVARRLRLHPLAMVLGSCLTAVAVQPLPVGVGLLLALALVPAGFFAALWIVRRVPARKGAGDSPRAVASAGRPGGKVD